MLTALNFHRVRFLKIGSGQVRWLRVLAIETSADDTAAAVVDDAEILANVVIKQHTEHEEFKGIHPQVAIRTHAKNLPTALRRALTESSLHINDIDGIAFTRGPGMPRCLGLGANAARTLAAALNKPLIGVHHMQAHALTALYTTQPTPGYPFLTLLVSGGHTLLLLAHSSTRFKILATTSDESVGNAFDRVAKLLDVPWSCERSAGASLEAFALGAPNSDVEFTIPLPGKLAFSYSGLISSARSHILKRSNPDMVIDAPKIVRDPPIKHPPIPERAILQERIRRTVAEMSLDERRSIAASFQKAAVGQLEAKLKLGLKKCARLGIQVELQGVVQGVESDTPIRLVFPPPALCTDNAVMIAWAALERFRAKKHDNLDIDIRPVWSIEDLYNPE